MRLATRASKLALAQAGIVAAALPVEVELVEVATSGDRGQGVGDKARWVKQIEEALLDGRADLAVHSAKDVPGELPPGLAIVGVPERADPRDALCGADSLDSLADGARVGTSSLRRRAQLLAARPDLDVVEMRGNVDTRLRKLADGEYDAIVLAMAGLERLCRDEGTPLPFVPAPGQGCLALEARDDDERIAELAASITHRTSLARLTAERAVCAALDASCHTPIGAHAELRGEQLELTAWVGLPDGSHWISDTQRGDAEQPAALGATVGERLIAAGASDLLAEAEAELTT